MGSLRLLAKEIPNPTENTVTAAGIVPLGVGPMTLDNNAFTKINETVDYLSKQSGGNGWSDDLNKNLPKAAENIGNFLISPNPVLKAAVFKNPFKGGSAAEQWKDVAEGALSPNPIIDIATGNADNILGNSGPVEKWEDVAQSEPVKAVTEPVKNLVEGGKETVQNVVKGVSDALPIIAIGAAGIVVLGLLLGRR